MKISKRLIKKIERISKASDLVHNLNVEIKKDFKKLGIPEEITQDNLTSLCYGDISGKEFLESIQSSLEEY